MCIDVSISIHFQRTHKTDIKSAIIIQIKLVCHIINRSRTDHSSKCLTRNRKTSNSAGLYCKCDHIQHSTFSGKSGNCLRYSNSDIYDIVHTQFLRCSFSDDVCRNIVFTLFLRKIIDFLIPGMPFFKWDLEASGKCHIRFVTLLRLCHNDCIYQTARNNGITWSGWCINQSVYLHNYFSPVCLYCLTNRKRISRHEHIIKCNIAFSVCRSSFDQRNGNLWKFIIQKFIPIHFNMFYQ